MGHITIKIVSAGLAMTFFSGCSLLRKDGSQQLERRVKALESELAKEKMKSKGLAKKLQMIELRKKSRINKSHNEELDSQRIVRPSSYIAAVKPATASNGLNEHDVYAKVIESFRKSSSELLKRSTRILMNGFPQSVHADNAMALNARLALRNSRWREVSHWTQELLKRYPYSDKTSLALQLNAEASLAQGHRFEAVEQMSQLIEAFPGSPSATWAQRTLKNIVKSRSVRKDLL